MDPGAAVFLGILAVGLSYIGVLLSDRRENRKAAEATAARIEAVAVADRKELETALRERIEFKDEQIKVRDEQLGACHERNAALIEMVRSLGGTP